MLIVVICIALLAAVNGSMFEYGKCIRVDVNGTVTVIATDKNTHMQENRTIDLSAAKHTITGSCSNTSTTANMTVKFGKLAEWGLEFDDKADKVTLMQTVSFDPATLFNDTAMPNETVAVTDTLALSFSNSSYLCQTEQTIPFSSADKGNYSYTVKQDITDIRAQAFNLPAKAFSPAEHCSGDKTTVAPTTAPTTVPTTTEPMPTPTPAGMVTFEVKDPKGIACFRLEAGLQFAVEYNTTDNKMNFSKPIDIDKSAKVEGTCANGTDMATMVISGTNPNFTLTITETRSKQRVVSALQLNVTLDPANFPKAEDANKVKTFEMSKAFELSSADTFYACNTDQELEFDRSRTTLYTTGVRLQAFNLNNGSFTGNGVRCGLDPSPDTTAVNTYEVVAADKSAVCIVLKGEVSFSNISYKADNGKAVAPTINIPAMNKSEGNVKFTGNCNMTNGTEQQLVITFNNNWTLALTFGKGPLKNSAMLTASADEFTLRDIEFVYYLVPEFFPNTTEGYTKQVARSNITSDFMKGSTGGGSYRCNAQQTQKLSNGVLFHTADLQYKAFNKDNTTSFSDDDVSDCSADDESNSIVPIAVGAALAGLVAIVLIAYLIGRRRSRRQGYESV